MKASFYEYNVAVSGLFTAKNNLNIISHNIANAAMPGYSRQYALQKASRPLYFADGRGMYGTGSEVYGVAQIRDIYLDRKYWHQNGILKEYETKSSHLELMELVFNDLPEIEPGKGTGIKTAFTNFFQRLQDLTTTTNDSTFRTNVTNAAQSLADLVRSNAEALQKEQRDINQEIDTVITRVNSLGEQITSLNRQIHQYENDGSIANDLRDQRALLIDDLSQYVNVEVEELDYSDETIPYDKRYTVSINGYDFVNHFSTHPLVCVPRDIPSAVTTTSGVAIPTDGSTNKKRNEMDVIGLYDLYFADSGARFDIYSTTLQGSLKGLIDIRDGNNGLMTEAIDITAVPPVIGRDPHVVYDDDGDPYYATSSYKGVPFYMEKLNNLVRTFARALNEGLDREGGKIPGVTGHLNSYDMYGLDSNMPSGRLFFTRMDGRVAYTGDDFADINTDDPANPFRTYKELNCLNFNVNPDLMEDPDLLACASDPSQGESANDVILGFAGLNSYPSLFKEGTLTDFIIATTDHMAIDRMQAMNFETSYSEITTATNNQRLSVSGVDLNEEFMAMIKYNQLYQACAKLVNVIDQVYDTMINRLGVS